MAVVIRLDGKSHKMGEGGRKRGKGRRIERKSEKLLSVGAGRRGGGGG